MVSSPPHRFSFWQLSAGLQILLILILIGSCSGASNNSVTNPGLGEDEAQQLREEVRILNGEVRQLRRELRQQR